MKYSKYNFLFPHERKFILYNTLSCNSLAITANLATLLKNTITKIDELKNIHPEFFQALAEGGFLKDDSTNEVEEIENLRLANLADKSQYHLTINPTLDCNFHCWYCYESKVKGSQMSPELVYSVNKFIENIINGNSDLERFHLYFFGGEPMLKFDSVLKPILNHFDKLTREKGLFRTLQITTNGVLVIDEIIDYIKSKNIHTSFQITFDGYLQNHNKSRFSEDHPQSYNQLISLIKYIIRSCLNVTLRINYTSKNVDDLEKILDEFIDCSIEERNRIIYTPVRVWQDTTKALTKQACDNLLKKENDDIVNAKANNTMEHAMDVGMKIMPINSIDSMRYPCKHSYINAASINYNGDVFKCCARSFDDINKAGTLNCDGAITWKEGIDQDILRKRTDHNISCANCIIFPICGGGCVQSFNDFKNVEYCLYQFDERSKEEAIKKLVYFTKIRRQ